MFALGPAQSKCSVRVVVMAATITTATLSSALDGGEVLGIPKHRSGCGAILDALLGRLAQQQHARVAEGNNAGGQETLRVPSGSSHVKPGSREGCEGLEWRGKRDQEALRRKRWQSLQKLGSEVAKPSCLVETRRRRMGTLVLRTKNKNGELMGSGNAIGKLLTSMVVCGV